MWSSLIGFTLLLTDYGWQKTPNGDIEYIIQIEPELLDALKRGEEIASVVPPRLGKVTRFRIRVGTVPVPRDAKVLQSRGKVRTPPDGGPTQASPAPGRAAPAGIGSREELRLESTEDRASAFRPGAERVAPAGIRDVPKPIPRKSTAEAEPIHRAWGFLPDDTQDAKTAAREMAGKAQRSPSSGANTRAAAGEPTGSAPEKTESRAQDAKAAPAARPTKARPASSATVPAPGEEAPTEKPWGVLVLTSLLLFASLALNLYLGWVARGAVLRYRELVCAKG